MFDETFRARWARYRRAVAGEPLPLAFVDMDAFDRNLETLLAPVRAAGKRLRVATKSLRAPALLRRVLERGAETAQGLMTYSARETAWLAERGFDDLLLAYPTVQRSDVDALASAAARGTLVRVVCDDVAHLEALDAAAARVGVTLRVLVDVDVSYRPFEGVHVGVRRSPLRTAHDAAAFARRVRAMKHLQLDGAMAYEAHVAGVADAGIRNAPKRWMKLVARKPLERLRAEVAEALRAEGHSIEIFNGGGTGSVRWASTEPALTEVTVGSGLLDSHLFDRYRELRLVPAAFFALQVVRRPDRGIVTCAAGGYVASGGSGPDRLPLPALPEGSRLLPLEGAGEVQTPIALPSGVDVAIGEPIFFRHAKAGELAEHFREYLLLRGDRIETRISTYRGYGECFFG